MAHLCSQAWLANLRHHPESEAAKIWAGLIDPFKVHRNRPIDDHLTDYLGFLRSEGSTAKHVSTTGARASGPCWRGPRWNVSPTWTRFASRTDWHDSVRAGCRRRPATTTCSASGRSPSDWSGTAGYRATRWLRCRPSTSRPTAAMIGGVLTQEEFDALIRATRSAEPFRGLSGDDRAMLYLVATYTGLRAAELASLTPAGFDLDADRPTVRVRTGYTKNREEAVVPLRPDLREQLRSYLAGRAVHAPVWPRSWVNRSRPRCCVPTWNGWESPTSMAMADTATSTPCGIASDRSWHGPTSRPRWRRH
jgi:hypothetical protein